MPPSPFPNSNRGEDDSSSSCHTCKTNTNNEEEDSTNKSSWFFSSWFENDNTQFPKQIHEHLNAWEEEQQQQRRGFLAPFFLSPWGRHPSSSTSTAATKPTTTLQEELQDFFDLAGLGHYPLEAGDDDRWGSSSSSSSTTLRSSTSSSILGGGRHAYQIMRRENHEGVQLDVTFPPTLPVQDVQVNVLEESPSCLVQWQVVPASLEDNGASTTTRTNFQDQARLGSRSSGGSNKIMCERLVASISHAHNRLTLKAPREQTNPHTETSSRPRRIPIQEGGGCDKKKE